MSPIVRPPLRCFQGLIPSAITTCDAQGEPNVTYVSQVFWMDDGHVALSCQFFNKTKRNLLENPYADATVYDPVSFDPYRLTLRFMRSETEGLLFDQMAARIEAIASQTGMKGIFRLLSADVFELVASERVTDFLLPDDQPCASLAPEPLVGPRSELRGLQRVSQALCSTDDLRELLAVLLEALDEAFGFEHAMVLLAEGADDDDDAPYLRLVDCRGFRNVVLGTRVYLGDGLIGTVAQIRKPLRFSGLRAELRYGRAVRSAAERSPDRAALGPELPLPGLPDSHSHIALPLLVADRLVGVLAVESKEGMAFDDWDEPFLEIVANQVAMALDNARGRGQLAAGEKAATECDVEESPLDTPGPRTASATPLRFEFFKHDDCVFFGGDYLVRNVPGRILWKLLRAHADTGRTQFSNRELRLDPWLGLPPVKDNLESRLALLRKRLDQRCPAVVLKSVGRGQFELQLDGVLELIERGPDADPTAG